MVLLVLHGSGEFPGFACIVQARQFLGVNLNLPPGDSVSHPVQKSSRPFSGTRSTVSVAFVLYTPVYAYVSGGGSVLQHALTPFLGVEPPRLLTSLFFALLLVACIWWSFESC